MDRVAEQADRPGQHGEQQLGQPGGGQAGRADGDRAAGLPPLVRVVPRAGQREGERRVTLPQGLVHPARIGGAGLRPVCPLRPPRAPPVRTPRPGTACPSGGSRSRAQERQGGAGGPPEPAASTARNHGPRPGRPGPTRQPPRAQEAEPAQQRQPLRPHAQTTEITRRHMTEIVSDHADHGTTLIRHHVRHRFRRRGNQPAGLLDLNRAGDFRQEDRYQKPGNHRTSQACIPAQPRSEASRHKPRSPVNKKARPRLLPAHRDARPLLALAGPARGQQPRNRRHRPCRLRPARCARPSPRRHGSGTRAAPARCAHYRPPPRTAPAPRLPDSVLAAVEGGGGPSPHHRQVPDCANGLAGDRIRRCGLRRGSRPIRAR